MAEQKKKEVRPTKPAEGGDGAAASPELAKKGKKIEAIVTKAVDLRGMAEAALGPRWKEMTESQRKRLVAAP